MCDMVCGREKRMRIASFQIIYFHPGNTAQWQNVGNRSWLRSVNVFWEIPGVTFQILP